MQRYGNAKLSDIIYLAGDGLFKGVTASMVAEYDKRVELQQTCFCNRYTHSALGFCPKEACIQHLLSVHLPLESVDHV